MFKCKSECLNALKNEEHRNVETYEQEETNEEDETYQRFMFISLRAWFNL
mgnify:CR=1 FL=1